MTDEIDALRREAESEPFCGHASSDNWRKVAIAALDALTVAQQENARLTAENVRLTYRHCPICDHGVIGGYPCEKCRGTGRDLDDFERVLMERAERAEADTARLGEALEKARTFIEYARYELQPGKAQIGDQFPKQDDADEHLALIGNALAPAEPIKETP